MAETPRSRADLLALMPDNVSGQISPRDLRDALVTALGCYGLVQVTGGAAEQTPGVSFEKLTGYAANGEAAGITPDHVDDSITLDVAGVYLAVCNLDAVDVERGSTCDFRLALDGTPFGPTVRLGRAAKWDDFRMPANLANPIGGGSFPADINNDTGCLAYAHNRDEYAALKAQMPHGWALGTPVRPHIHWIRQAAGGIVWQLEYQILPVGEVVAYPDWTVLPATEADEIFSYTSGNLHQVTSFPEIDMSGAGLSAMLAMRLARLGSDAGDTLDGDAEVEEFDLHIQIYADGSDDEFAQGELEQTSGVLVSVVLATAGQKLTAVVRGSEADTSLVLRESTLFAKLLG
jgi:hypothetical protein